MPACGGDFSLCVLDRPSSSAKWNPQPLEAVFQLEAGKLEQLGCLPEIDPLVEVVAEHLSFEKIVRTGTSTRGAKSEGSKEAIIESVQEDNTLLPSAGNDGELSLLHPVQDFSGPLGQVGR